MPISLLSLDVQQVLQQIQKEVARPADQVDRLAVLRFAAQLCAAELGLPGLAAVAVPWGGVSRAVRALVTGQRTQPGALSVLGLDPAGSESACARVERLRDALGVALGLAEPLKATLQKEAGDLHGEAKDRYDTVRSLTALPEVAAALQPATDHFYGPAFRAAGTRAVARKAADRARSEDKPTADPTAPEDTLLTLAPAPARRRTRRG